MLFSVMVARSTDWHLYASFGQGKWTPPINFTAITQMCKPIDMSNRRDGKWKFVIWSFYIIIIQFLTLMFSDECHHIGDL